MKSYVVLLRGINVSGKNRVSMKELKLSFYNIGFFNVKTVLNSGNVIFNSDEDVGVINNKIFDLFKCNEIPFALVDYDKISMIIKNKPLNWNTSDKSNYYNVVFVLPHYNVSKVLLEVGEPSKNIESINVHEDVIYWSFDLKTYSRCNWYKKMNICPKVTIRNYNTVNKIYDIMKSMEK